ncbi:hypothetical protein PCE1_003818 [Barthelona sp. PCE]
MKSFKSRECGGLRSLFGKKKNKKVKLFHSTTNDPYFNLATENYLLHHAKLPEQTLYLWQNAPVIVIGVHQNPWRECHVNKLQEDDIFLARRTSGGGCVFHDLGNTNFTFLSKKSEYNKENNNSIILTALNDRFGLKGEASGRNDLLIDGKKFSGAAFKEARDRAFHHGTLLIDVDLQHMSSYLTPSKKKLESKATKSVKARVVNLHSLNPEVTHETLTKAIEDEFQRFYGEETEVEMLQNGVLEKIPELMSLYHNQRDWNWIFGKTPAFAHKLETRFDWGEVVMHVVANGGVIKELKVYSDCLSLALPGLIEGALSGCAYDADAITKRLMCLATDYKDLKGNIIDVADFIAESIKEL